MTRRPTIPQTASRRRVLRGTGVALAGLAVGTAATGGAAARPGKPSFGDEIYGDGRTWGTKFTTELPPPSDNEHSYDDLYFVVDEDDVPVQLPVSDSVPGDQDYNGGRWACMTATVTDHDAYADLAPLTDDDAVHEAQDVGAIGDFRLGAPEPNGGDPVRPTYFQCPLLPTK